MNPARDHRQRGAAALAVTLVLFFVMTLVAAYANRNHVFEQRASANQYRATQAFEAAEAGLEWAIAMLNDPRAIDTDCRTDSSGDTSFRERHLRPALATGAQVPLTWNQAGANVALRSACIRDGSGWRCACPSRDHPRLAPAADGEAPAFLVQFAAAAQPGSVQLVATGCSSLGGACAPGDDRPADASARLQVTLALVPALATPPVAPLTVRDSVNAGAAAIGLHNADAGSGGVAVHAGAAIVAANARLTGAPGAPGATMIERDTSLHALAGERFFASFFGIDKALWQQQPGVVHVSCRGPCGDAVLQAAGRGSTPRMLWIDGDLQLDGVMTIGTRERPVLIVASGAVRFSGPVALHGVVYGASIGWNGTGGGLLRGAAISEGGYEGSGAPDLVYDSTVLAALRSGSGSFARLPGSWKDF